MMNLTFYIVHTFNIYNMYIDPKKISQIRFFRAVEKPLNLNFFNSFSGFPENIENNQMYDTSDFNKILKFLLHKFKKLNKKKNHRTLVR